MTTPDPNSGGGARDADTLWLGYPIALWDVDSRDWEHRSPQQTIRRTLAKRASAMFRAAATRKVWWTRSYLQNHLWVNACGLAAAGLAASASVLIFALFLG